ncbi:MAG: HD domain-containing protein [Candidatus Woesearchaeota archaeon]
MLDEIKEIIKKEIPEQDQKYHVSLVVKYSKQLAAMLGEDEEIAEIAALLHDIGGYRRGWDDHELKGAEEAGKILQELHCPEKTIEKVEHCILSHRSNGKNLPTTKLAKIIQNADALAHFDAIPWLFSYGLEINNNNIEKAEEWLLNKLERDYKHKLDLPESKKLAEEKLKAARLIFSHE